MARIILIHGAAHGGWCWSKLVPLLRSAGHEVAAPDLPGMGADRTPLGEITLAVWGDFVADLLRVSQEPAILVGHSRGGIVIGEAAEREPERVLGLVYVTAMLLPPGSIAFELSADMANKEIVQTATFDDISMVIDLPAARNAFYDTCDTVDVDWALSQLCPEPIAPNKTPLTTTEAHWGALPRAYIECLDDKVLSIDYQRQMQAAYPCDPVVSLSGGHSPFLSQPQELAYHLDAIAKLFAGRHAV